MAILKKTLYVSVGLGALAARKVRTALHRLEEEGRNVLQQPDHPVHRVRQQIRSVADEGRSVVQSIATRLYYTLGLTPLQETQRLHARVDEIESRVYPPAQSNAAHSNS